MKPNEYRRTYEVETKFKNVYPYVSIKKPKGPIIWIAKLTGGYGEFSTEREAAIYVDKVRIKNGKEPVNILKRKTEKQV